MVVLLFSLKDFDTVLTSTTGPLLQIYYQATESRTGVRQYPTPALLTPSFQQEQELTPQATCLMMFNLVAMCLAGQGILTVSSRLVLTFARDRGMGHVSPFISNVNARLKVPVTSIVFVTVLVVAIGLISESTLSPHLQS